MDQNLIDAEEVSPASIIHKTFITWDDTKVAKQTSFDGNTVTFVNTSSFKFARSNETFESGRHTFNIKIASMNYSGLAYGSIGVCWNESQIMDAGSYLVADSHMYANYWPAISHGTNQIFNSPPKFKEGDTIGIIADFNDGKIEFLLNDVSIFITELKNEGKPIFVFCGTFGGTFEIV